MFIYYLGGKTNHKKCVHVYYVSPYRMLDSWLPSEDKLNNMLEKNAGSYGEETVWGYNIYEVKA